MIVSANEARDFVSSILRISENNPFACRIVSLYNSYQPGLAFVDYWLITDNEGGMCRGAIARNGTCFIIFMTDERDVAEVSAFMRVAGASTVICDGKYNMEFYGGEYSEGPILMRDSKIEPKPSDNVPEYRVISPSIQAAYYLMVKCADENFRPPSYEDFYVDVNHKLRHNAARLFGIADKGRLVAFAMTIAESGDGAVLGAVSCDPDYRKQGYGSEIVSYITNNLIDDNKSVYLHRAKNANAVFYNKLGFSEIGKWKEYYFN